LFITELLYESNGKNDTNINGITTPFAIIDASARYVEIEYETADRLQLIVYIANELRNLKYPRLLDLVLLNDERKVSVLA
jgi:hypothetical protein